MPDYTTNYNLVKPLETEKYDIKWYYVKNWYKSRNKRGTR